MKDRKDIPAKYKWDLSVIYADEKAFYEDYAKVEKMIKEFPKHEKTMTKSAEGLYNVLRAECDIEAIIEKLWSYASLNFSVDSTNNAFQALNGKVRALAVQAGSASWFVSPRILALDNATVEGWFKEYPELETFRRTVHSIMRTKPHMLSDECEQLMSRLQDGFGTHGDIRSIFANSDLRFGKIRNEEGKLVELTDTNYVTFLMSGNRRVRQAAFRKIYETYAQFGNTFATTFNAMVRERGTLAKVRGYKNSITASTFRDEVTPEIYNNLINSVHTGLPALYDYYELKREVLGVDKLHMYDLYAPLIGELDKKYPYEEAVEEVIKTVEVFGEEYHSTLTAGLKEKGWVDVYPSKGKRGGAYSSGCYDTQPYMLLNFVGTLDNVSTFAHESGHSMHSYFSRQYNAPQNSSYTIFVAEVASTVNELLFCHRKLRESDSKEEKLAILNQIMETYKGTLYRQTMFAEFEKTAHAMVEGGATLTKDVLCKTYYDIVCKYFGPDVVCDKEIANEWMRIPHFYTNFYVYKYATCISAASTIVHRIETEGEEYIGKYIDFLKCGGSKSPLDSLLVAGIDMRDPQVVKNAINDFAATIAQYKELSE